ncbi:MAG: vWA domain-containing protein [Thermomicrobiales bacterium]
MKRVTVICMLVAVCLLPSSSRPFIDVAGAQAEIPPIGTPVSEPARAGDWTFQVLAVERFEDYYAERLARVEQPNGIFLVVSMAITYEGTSANDGDRLVPGLWFEVTAPDGTVYPLANAHTSLEVEDSYLEETPFPPLPSNGVAEPGVKHFHRYMFDVPAGATGLTLTSHSTAPGPFAFPLPDGPSISGPVPWELTVSTTELRATLEPPLTANEYQAEGVYVVVYVELTKLFADEAIIDLYWFGLRSGGTDMFEVALEESFEMGAPSVTDAEPRSWEFALVFDLPPGIEDLTLISNPGAPIDVEIPLTLTIPPTPTPTPAPTSTPAITPTPSPTPAPGSIRVVASESGQTGGRAPLAAGAAVELILDTSGSMLQPLGDQLRINVAKAALIDLVTTTLPPETPLALRVFGTEPDSCETTLAVPFAPLDPEAVAAQIGAIQAVNLVRTPIGAALEQVATDLADAGEPRIIVLVTDGEETCGGDPEAAIRSLIDQGIDVHVNIVGFALDDDALRSQFQSWADLGRGRYIDAGNADELRAAITAAVQPPFRVLDQDGEVVAQGVVGGDPVTVPSGTYQVEILTDPIALFEDVVVTPGAEARLALEND